MSEIIGIFGITFTIAFGIPAIIGIIRHRGPKMVLIETDIIDINNRLLTGIQGLEIKLHGKELVSNVYHYRCVLVNNGNSDIAEETVKGFPIIELPDGAIWLSCKVREACKRVKYSIEHKEGVLELRFDLLKPNEYISVEGFIKSEDHIGIDSFSISHRIKDLSNIERKTNSSLNSAKSKSWKFLALALSLLALIVFVSITAKPLLDLTVYNTRLVVIDSEGNKLKKLDINDFKNELKPELNKRTTSYISKRGLTIDIDPNRYLTSGDLTKFDYVSWRNDFEKYIDIRADEFATNLKLFNMIWAKSEIYSFPFYKLQFYFVINGFTRLVLLNAIIMLVLPFISVPYYVSSYFNLRSEIRLSKIISRIEQ